MPEYSTEIQQLIETVRISNPSLYTALSLLNQQIFDLNIQLNPLVRQAVESQIIAATLDPPTSFDYSLPGRTVRFIWSAVSGAHFYEIRLGSNWDTASLVVRTPSLQADIDPLLIGIYTYLIKTLTADGIYSDNPTSLVVTIPTIPPPIVMAQVIDNNVLLTWNTPISSFEISHFLLYKDDVLVGQVNGNFTTVFELASGTYEYSIIAVDLAGNRSLGGTLPVTVNTPPDYELQDTRISILNGTRVNVVYESIGPRLVASYVTETWGDHFTVRSWNTIADQIAAGYPIYLQPTNTTGSYEERIDYGGVFTSTIITVSYTYRLISGSNVATVIQMQTSTDDITYSAYTPGAVQFFASFRYLRFKLEFTGADDKALVEITNVTIKLDVKREQDGGIVACVSTDAGGTTVTFNKSFKDIEALTATPMGTTDRKAIIDFTDVPNPTSFKVLLFDNAGARASGDARWMARGIT